MTSLVCSVCGARVAPGRGEVRPFGEIADGLGKRIADLTVGDLEKDLRCGPCAAHYRKFVGGPLFQLVQAAEELGRRKKAAAEAATRRRAERRAALESTRRTSGLCSLGQLAHLRRQAGLETAFRADEAREGALAAHAAREGAWAQALARALA